jgi:hypothetical protein
MISEKLKIKTQAHYEKNNIKVVDLQNLRYFFDGLYVLANKWNYKSFNELYKLKDQDLKYNAYNILVGLLYYRMCTPRGWEVNLKRFKNNLLLKNKYSILFRMEGEILEVSDHYFDKAIKWLKENDFITTGSHHSYIEINNHLSDKLQKLGNYLFNTRYAQRSIAENTHYFGDPSKKSKTDVAFEERAKINKERLH